MVTNGRPMSGLLVGSTALILLVGALAMVVARTATVVGAGAQEEEGFLYAAKFACVDEVGPPENGLGAPVIPARYRTVVNVHNPQRDGVEFQKKAVVAFSQRAQERGPISDWKDEGLGPDEALAVDCLDIRELLGGDQRVGDGFLVIESKLPLDVVAVYTTESVGIETRGGEPGSGPTRHGRSRC